MPAPVTTPTASFSWSGCYLGGHMGLAGGHTTWKDTVPNGAIDATGSGQTANTDMSGGLYGGQIGCDYQFGNLVAGIEGSFSAATLAGTNMDQFNSTWTLRSKTDWLGSVTGRLGFTADRALIYARGGIAWAHNDFEIENTAILAGKPSLTRMGWVLGAGVEWSLAPCWTAFVEGDYYSFVGKNVPFAGDAINPTPPFVVQTSQTIETLKVGVNYRF
jgi:outer membrane immunogenic protein